MFPYFLLENLEVEVALLKPDYQKIQVTNLRDLVFLVAWLMDYFRIELTDLD